MTSTGRGQVGGRRAVEEPALRQAHVGQQVAVASRLVGEHAGEILADHQAGDADVAAEELVAHRHDAHVVAAELVDERREDPRAVLAGEDRDRRASRRGQEQRHVPAARLREPGVRSVALGRRAVDPREEAGCDAGRRSSTRPVNSSSNVRAMPMPSSCIGKPS